MPFDGLDGEGGGRRVDYRSEDVEEMSEPRDPAIKLFGRTIPLPDSSPNAVPPPPEKDVCGEITRAVAEVSMSDVPENPSQVDPDSSSCLSNRTDENHHKSTSDVAAMPDLKPEQDETEAEASTQEKILKKPDKILPCPRCSSMDTKFCYYNNYNVNQPRHFCKNCHRYWTAGGTMRNVPVGAGRRKNKQCTSQYRHLMMSTDGVPKTRVDAGDFTNHQAVSGRTCAPFRPLNGNGAVLKSASEGPLCESMASVLNLGEHHRSAEISPMPCEVNMEEPSCRSSLTASNCIEYNSPNVAAPINHDCKEGCSDGNLPLHNSQGYPLWADAWAVSMNNTATMVAGRCSSEFVKKPDDGRSNPVPWSPLPLMPSPAYCAPTIPFPFMPAPFWGCMSSWPNGWIAPWAGSNGCLSPPSPASTSGSSANGSPTLGKHSRDDSLAEENVEKSLWIPKTLRIDDPDDAAKSSIWATLGIRPDEHFKSGGVFKAFHSKTGSKAQTSEADRILVANPAALCRFQSFQENT